MLLHPNHFLTAFCGQRAPFGYVATFVLGNKSGSVARLNMPALTVMLCSSHSFHPSVSNTISTNLSGLVYRPSLPSDCSQEGVCKHASDVCWGSLLSCFIFLLNLRIHHGRLYHYYYYVSLLLPYLFKLFMIMRLSLLSH